jgi:hypothetical protein
MSTMIIHKWGANAMSPCGLSVALVYSTNDVGFSGIWADVTCPECRAPKPEENSRTSGTNEEPSYMAFARTHVRLNEMSSPRVVKLLIERIDALTKELNELKGQ